MKEDNKMQMSLNWNDNKMTFIVDKIEIPVYDGCTPSDHDILARMLNPRIKRYDTIYDTKLYLDEDFMIRNYPYITNNANVKFHIIVDYDVENWFNKTYTALSRSIAKKSEVVANGVLTFHNASKNIENAFIECIDNDYCTIIADF